MTGLMIGLMVALTTICLASLAGLALMVWWTLDSSGRHSISAGKQSLVAVESMREAMGQTAGMVKIQADLTETLLLGRPMSQETDQPLTIERPAETLPTPDELWQDLPDNIREAMQREAEEESTWPEASETLQRPSPDPEESLEEEALRIRSLLLEQ